ncbi:MAG: energy-coupling factor transporter ATPase [Clostridia bacterium]|nr:energy-coupling factor transporter ATPase [Clostridia bacterium]
MDVVAENLNFTYSPKTKGLSFRALQNVNLTIKSGEIFGIIGKTGSGKSTFVQHINGLIKVQKGGGALKVGDYDLTDKKCDYKSLRAKVGMMFQYPEHQLFAETVAEDVAFALKNFAKDLSAEEISVRVKEALNTVGLDYNALKDKSPFDLSGGQKRRVAIAGVIVAKPEILVLDEPAAGLDPKGKREFLELLLKLHKDFVKTIIIVSHDMNLVAEYCTRAAVFSGGKIIATGTPKEIFSDRNIIEKSGLDLPLTAALTEKLKSKGIITDSDFTVEDFTEKLVVALKNGGKIR